jgi:hypothetical membrane protein
MSQNAVNRTVVAGLLLFLAIFQFFMFFRVAESIYPGYSVSNNYISDLGVGPAAGVFNTSIVVLGLAVMAAAYLALPAFRSRVLSVLVGLAGFGATGVGVFPENVPVLHTVMSFITFFFAGVAAVYAARVFKQAMGVLSLISGLTSLTALALFATNNYLGLGHGGMERLIVYPVLSWGLLIAGYLLTAGRQP